MSNTKLNKNQVDSTILTSSNFIAGTGISIDEIPQPMIDENTLGVWHFDGNTDNAVNNSAIQFLYQPLSYSSIDAKFGNAMSGLENYGNQVINGLDFDRDKDFTFDVWFNRKQYLNYSELFGASNTVCLETDYRQGATAVWQMRLGNSYKYQIFTTEMGKWYHIAFERYNGTFYAYFNGKCVAQLAASEYVYGLQIESKENQSFYDELRISNVARYKGQDFTPYTVPYSSGSTSKQYQINTFKNITGYNTSNTQKLKNVEGVLTWVNEN